MGMGRAARRVSQLSYIADSRFIKGLGSERVERRRAGWLWGCHRGRRSWTRRLQTCALVGNASPTQTGNSDMF
jgi:hypothetical protein